MSIRLDTITEMDPGAPDPVGTRAEIKRAKLPLLKYGTCSQPTKASRGCKHFNHPQFGPCPIRALLAARSRPGPENVGYIHITSPTVWKRDITTCYNYMDNYEHEDPKGGQSHITAIGGDNTVLKVRGSEVLEPGNPRSLSKTCFHPLRVPKFKRPEESLADRMEVLDMSTEIRKAQALRSGEVLSGALEDGVGDEEELRSDIDPEDEDGEIELDDSDGEGPEFPAEADDFDADEPEPALVRQVSTGKAEREPKRESSTKPAKRSKMPRAKDDEA